MKAGLGAAALVQVVAMVAGAEAQVAAVVGGAVVVAEVAVAGVGWSRRR